MTAAEARRYPGLPGWRIPGGTWSDAVVRERMSLREVAFQLASDRPQTIDELLVAVREAWGVCERDQLRSVVVELIADGELCWDSDDTIVLRGER